MKKFTLGILLLCGTVTCVLAAQQQASMDRPAEPNFAFDDDGNKAQIVPINLAVAGPKTFHDGPMLSSTQQVSIFLNADWGDAQVRAREASLLDVTASAKNTQIAKLKQHSIKTLHAAPKLKDFSDLSQSKMN